MPFPAVRGIPRSLPCGPFSIQNQHLQHLQVAFSDPDFWLLVFLSCFLLTLTFPTPLWLHLDDPNNAPSQIPSHDPTNKVPLAR